MRKYININAAFWGLAILVLASCSDPAPLELKHGYIFAVTNKYNNWIIKDGKPVVDSYISEYEIVGDYVLGERVASQRPDLEPVSDHYGYFILNMNTGELVESLSKNEIAKFRKENIH